jgi:thioredoxin 1
MFKNTQRGSAVIVVIVIFILILGGGTWYLTQESFTEGDAVLEGNLIMEKDEDAMMEKDGSNMMEEDSKMKEDGNSVMEEDVDAMMHSGEVLAGKNSPYLVFNKTDFDSAVKSDKLVVLYFYANWCPTCKAEQPKAHAAFDEFTGDDVIGFRVNYNDNQTDADEKELAKEHGVGYQHTKVFIKNGERILKSPESWDKNRYLSEIKNALAQ